MTIQEISLADVPAAHPAAVFHRFWRQAAGGRRWASWALFDAVDHPTVLPWVLLLKSEPGEAGRGCCWRYAVCGTGCTELFGFSYQGKLFGAGMPAEAAAERLAEFDRVIHGEGAQFSSTSLPIPGKDFVKVFRGVFPFATGTAGVDRLLVVLAREDTRVN